MKYKVVDEILCNIEDINISLFCDTIRSKFGHESLVELIDEYNDIVKFMNTAFDRMVHKDSNSDENKS